MQISKSRIYLHRNTGSSRPVFFLARVSDKIRLTVLIFLLQISGYAGTIDTVMIPSSAMGQVYKACVILPEEYHQMTGHFYPSVYLLHGWSGSYMDWPAHADLSSLADRFHMLIVCPDGGYAGWYMDSPYQEDSKFESYLVRDVLPFVQDRYRVSRSTDQNFICGLSMGGFGALRFLSHYPELFAAAGSMSGVLQLNTRLSRYGLTELIGDSLVNPILWAENDAINFLQNLLYQSKGIIIDCGVDDPFITMNRSVHQYLLEIDLQHDYWERPGGHTWSYWTNALEYHLIYFHKMLVR